MNHVYINVQTLGRRPGCGIVALAYATFNHFNPRNDEKEQKAQLFIPVSENLKYGFSSDPETIKWWTEKNYYEVLDAKNEGRIHSSMPQILSEFASQLDELYYKHNIRSIWCKYPTFHISILNAALDKLNIERPMLLRDENFRSWRCAATLLKGLTGIHKPISRISISSGSSASLISPSITKRALEDVHDTAFHLSSLFSNLLKSNNATLENEGLKTRIDTIESVSEMHRKRAEELALETMELIQKLEKRARSSKSKRSRR